MELAVINSIGFNGPKLDIRTLLIAPSCQSQLAIVREAPEILYTAASSSQQRENNHDQGIAGYQSPDSGKWNIIGTFYTESTHWIVRTEPQRKKVW